MKACLNLALIFITACSCDGVDDGPTFYERNIEPILVRSCAGQTSGCHAVDETDAFGFAAGNFDVTSFENVQKRRDLLKPFGAYNEPALLIKAVGARSGLGVNYNGEFLELEIQHVSNAPLSVGSEAYLTLLEWTQNGATANGLPPEAPPRTGEGDCSSFVPEEFDESTVNTEATLSEFISQVQPVLNACNAGSCHGAPQADFYITCGDNARQLAFNFSQARAFVDSPVDNSQILKVPLAEGGFHTGGEHYTSRQASNYVTVAEWAAQVGRVDFGQGDPGREFFANEIQPLLLTRGCSFEACHSPQATNDFQLRSGSPGFFSAIALERNYEKLLNNFMAVEVPDARRGRAVAKGILGTFGGINHRAGAVVETPGSGGSQPSTCASPFDSTTASAYCKLQEWINIERQKLLAANQIDELAEAQTVPVVYVERATNHVADINEFDVYQPDSDLLVDQATIGVEGALTIPAPAPVSLLANCPGAGNLAQVDVRSPDVHPNGQLVTFAMRTAAADPLGVYTVNIDGSNCVRITPAEPAVSGVMIHNFDPAFSNDGASIAYASTRGAEGGSPAPSVSRQFFQPQSDIWRANLDGSNAERITFLTNAELSPQFMREGRVIMTTEKISEGFYQMSGRRMNWDLTDYHPLLGQRAQSEFGATDDPTLMRDSVSYQRATEIREGFDGNFLVIFSDPGTAAGAGNLGIFNRSVGPMEVGRDDPGFLESLVFPDSGSNIGRVGATSEGAYRSPFPLLDNRIMVSHTTANVDLGSATDLDFDVVMINPNTGATEVLIGGPRSQLEAVLAIRKPVHEMFINKRQLVFGGKQDIGITGGPEFAVAHFPDAPLIFTLLNANLRRGRPVDLFRDATRLAVYQEGYAAPGSSAGANGIFEDRTLIGRADLADDGSTRVRVPSGVPVILELQDDSGSPVVTMREEHQFGRGENISFGIIEPLFDAVCAGCHGTVSGQELDVFVTPDALTGASESLSQNANPVDLQ